MKTRDAGNSIKVGQFFSPFSEDGHILNLGLSQEVWVISGNCRGGESCRKIRILFML
jgi:hypothetical protein